jgi:hypothetical protein
VIAGLAVRFGTVPASGDLERAADRAEGNPTPEFGRAPRAVSSWAHCARPSLGERSLRSLGGQEKRKRDQSLSPLDWSPADLWELLHIEVEVRAVGGRGQPAQGSVLGHFGAAA